VCNPVAGGGRGGRLLGPLLAALGAGGEVAHATSAGPGDEARLARQAIQAGHDVVVALGGDGTWSNVAGAVLAAERPVRLGLVPGGTGSDLAKTLGIPARDVAACARIVRAGHARAIDVGRIEDRHFLNIAGFGYDVAVLEDSWKVKWLSGPPVYLYCAVRQLASYAGFPLEQQVDGGEPRSRDLLMLIVANCRVFGGGFQIAPAADPADGQLDVMAFHNVGLLRRVGLMVGLLRGTHGRSPSVEATRTGRLRLRFPSPPAYEVDGEWCRAATSELVISVVPGALEVLVPHA
jgi:diacylglycerol kinase (ATP)